MENKIVVWRDGSYKVCDTTFEYENDPDWLVTIPGAFKDVVVIAAAKTLDALKMVIEAKLVPYDSDNIHPMHFGEKKILQDLLSMIKNHETKPE